MEFPIYSITNISNILDLVDLERRGEYVLADVKSATWIFECSFYIQADVCYGFFEDKFRILQENEFQKFPKPSMQICVSTSTANVCRISAL
jgi:hypothetical protein